MPIYDFHCPQCNYTEEYLLNLYEEDIVCKKCLNRMQRLMGAPHFKFKNASDVANSSSFNSGKKQAPILPLNIIDDYGDGTYKVSSTAKDPELLDG